MRLRCVYLKRHYWENRDHYDMEMFRRWVLEQMGGTCAAFVMPDGSLKVIAQESDT